MRRIGLLGILIAASPALAGVPGVMTFVGALQRGESPADGTFSAVFDLYEQADGGSPVFTQANDSVAVVAGALIVDLGDDPTNPLDADVLDSDGLFLSVTVDGTTFIPRIPLTSIAYADRVAIADDATTLQSLAVDGIVALNTTGAGLVQTGGTFSLALNGVTTDKIADAAVTTDKIADDGIGRTALADGSVTNAALAPAAVTTADLEDRSLTDADFRSGAINVDDLADNSISSANVESAGVAATAIGAGAASASSIVDGSLTVDDFNGSNLVPVFRVSSAVVNNCPVTTPIGQLTTTETGCFGCGDPPSGCSAVAPNVLCGGGASFACLNTLVGNLLQ